MALQNINIANKELVELTDEKQIQPMYEKNREVVDTSKRQYYEIDVTDAMSKLAQCGSLIQLAYASSNGFACQADVVELLSKYGTLVKNTYDASAKFVVASVGALKYHKLALRISTKSVEKSLQFIGKCSELAGRMSIVASEMTEQVGVLVVLSETALKAAVKDKSVTTEQRKQMEEMMKRVDEKRVELETATKQLAATIQDVKKKEQEAVEQAEAERKRAFIGKIITGVVTAGISTAVDAIKGSNDDDDNKDDSAAARAKQLADQRFKLQQDQIAQNAELARSVQQLKNCSESKDKLASALKSIEITIKTLGKIKVIFSNTQLFWKGVKANCVAIVDNAKLIKDIGDIDLEMFQEEIGESALKWFVLCKVNFDAKQAIIAVDKGMDKILNDLPNESEALKLVDSLSDTMIKSLDDENVKIKQIQGEEKKAIEAQSKK